jgi:hypothetical protein
MKCIKHTENSVAIEGCDVHLFRSNGTWKLKIIGTDVFFQVNDDPKSVNRHRAAHKQFEELLSICQTTDTPPSPELIAWANDE